MDTLAQANKRVNDIIGYERTPIALNAYYNNIAVCAYFQHDSGGYADRRFAMTSEDLAIYFSDASWLGDYAVDRIYYTLPSVYPRYWSLYYFGGGPAGDAGDPIPAYLRKDVSPYFPWDGDSADISSAVNAGRFLVTHRDHGSRSGWGDPYYSTTHVNALTNGDRLPVVWSMNCETGWFDNETDDSTTTTTTEVNFTEAWERNPNGGAVGLIGATRVTYSGHNDRLCWGWTDAVWPGFLTYSPSGTPFDGPAWEMGSVLNYGKYYYATTYSEGTYRKIEFEMFHWYGDPTMQIWTSVPQNLSVTHAAAAPVGATSFDVSLSACTGALIAISRDGQLLGRAYSTGGTATISWSTPLAPGDQLLVTVTGHNYRPYQAMVDCGDICECDLDHDGDCDMSDYFLFGDDWGRTDCPTTTASSKAEKKIVDPNDRDTGNPADVRAAESAAGESRMFGEAIPDPHATPAAVQRSPKKKVAAESIPDADRVAPAPATPASVWSRLQRLSDADKANATLQLEVGGGMGASEAAEISRIESLWNLGKYGQAIEVLSSLEGGGLDVAAGISWKTAKTVDEAEWVSGDIRIGSREDIEEASLDYDAQTGHLFAVLRRAAGDDPRWAVYFSEDNGQTWYETFIWTGGENIDLSASVVDQYLYIGYVDSSYPTEARIRRCFVSNGAVDGVYFYQTVFNKEVNIKEISLNTNADDSDNRVYYYAILTDFRLIHYWSDQLGTTWSEMNTGITDAWQGLDSTWNEGYSSLSGNGRFVSYVGYIIEGAEVANPIVVARRNNLGVWDRTVVDSDPYYDTLTGISAYQDHIITVFEYEDASGNKGIKYWISYNGGDNWYYSYVAPAQSGKNYWCPDVAARGGGGIVAIFQEEVGEPDPLWTSRREYSGSWSTPEQFNEIDVVTGSQVEVEYVPPLPGNDYAHGAYWKSWAPNGAWFDRSDGGSPVDPCECDLDNDGDCDMSDYFFFGEDWGRTDCP